MKNLVVALILILAAGTGAVYFASSSVQETMAPATTSPLDEDFDYYVQDMRATRFGSDGQAVSQLQAARVTHYPDDERAELEAPAFKSFDVNTDAWQVSAAAGTLRPDAERAEDRLELRGEVELYKLLAREDFLDVRTSELTVFTDSEEVINDAPVTLRMRGSQAEGAKGMRALLAQDYIQLNDSNGTHDPTPRP